MCRKRAVITKSSPIIESPEKPRATENSIQKPLRGGVGPIRRSSTGASIRRRYTPIQNAPCSR
jgi:hypothetical protein